MCSLILSQCRDLKMDVICKTVLNLLEAIYLTLRKIVVERITVVKFGVEAVVVMAVTA